MNELGLYDTPEEIADAILSKVNSLGSIRKATINSKCNNEAMFNKVLDLLKGQGAIDFDSNFIFKKGQGTGTEVNPQSWTQHLLFICEEEH